VDGFGEVLGSGRPTDGVGRCDAASQDWGRPLVAIAGPGGVRDVRGRGSTRGSGEGSFSEEDGSRVRSEHTLFSISSSAHFFFAWLVFFF
jgi:hypothetical protein